jgi:hypothetical protein
MALIRHFKRLEGKENKPFFVAKQATRCSGEEISR